MKHKLLILAVLCAVSLPAAEPLNATTAASSVATGTVVSGTATKATFIPAKISSLPFVLEAKPGQVLKAEDALKDTPVWTDEDKLPVVVDLKARLTTLQQAYQNLAKQRDQLAQQLLDSQLLVQYLQQQTSPKP